MMDSNTLLLLMLSSLLWATFCVATQAPVPGPDEPVLAGYDLVAYHSLAPWEDGVPGNPSISLRNTNGYTYYFSTEQNRAAFQANPDKYLPMYGGFCAWGIAWEYPKDGWPWAVDHMGPPCGPRDGWAILDGRLYCSIWRSYQTDFNKRDGREEANARWIRFYGSLEGGPQNNGCYAWNWQECFDRSIHTSVTSENKHVPEVSGGDEQSLDRQEGSTETDRESLFNDTESYEVHWSNSSRVLQDTVSWRWTLENISMTAPSLIVELVVDDLSPGNYIAFGIAEQLMEGALVVCFEDDLEQVGAKCKTYFGQGMGITTPKTDPVKPVVLSAARSDSSLTLQFSASLFGCWQTPQLPARVLIARGLTSGTSAPQPHLNNRQNRQAVTGVELLSVVSDHGDLLGRPRTQPEGPVEPMALPDKSLWKRAGSGQEQLFVLNDRVRVGWDLFHYEKEEIIEIQLDVMDVAEEETYRYVGFGISDNAMTGLIVTCVIPPKQDIAVTQAGRSSAALSECKQWRGFGSNLLPLTEASGWFVLPSLRDDGEGLSFTLTGRADEVMRFQETFVFPLRAICAVGRATNDTLNPLMHSAGDRVAFYLSGLSLEKEGAKGDSPAPTLNTGISGVLLLIMLVSISAAFGVVYT